MESSSQQISVEGLGQGSQGKSISLQQVLYRAGRQECGIPCLIQSCTHCKLHAGSSFKYLGRMKGWVSLNWCLKMLGFQLHKLLRHPLKCSYWTWFSFQLHQSYTSWLHWGWIQWINLHTLSYIWGTCLAGVGLLYNTFLYSTQLLYSTCHQ